MTYAQRPRSSYLAVGAVLAVVSIAAPTAAAAPRSDGIPLLGMPRSIVAERDMPPAVLARALRAQRTALARARAAAKLKPTRVAGCLPNDHPGELGPPPPNVTASIFGRHVEVVVRFPLFPRDRACRPTAIQVTTHGKPTTQVGPFPWSLDFQLDGPVGRAVIRLPPYATAPYRLSVTATAGGSISKRVEQRLSCPPDGCMRGESYSPPSDRDPHRVLPLRGVDRRSLEESFRTALAVNRRGPYTMRDVGCRSLKTCEATYADPLFPDMPYRVRYRIEGEQRAGCWMARDATVLDPVPYEDAYRGSISPAGCVSWLR